MSISQWLENKNIKYIENTIYGIKRVIWDLFYDFRMEQELIYMNWKLLFV